MFATVRINTPLESIEPYKSVAAKRGRVVLTGLGGADAAAAYEFLVVPERAVVDTGSKKVVYVEREPGMFEGVEVELGPRHDDYYPVIKGLNAGRQGGRRGRLPDRRRNTAQPGRRLDLLRRQRRPAVQRSSQCTPSAPSQRQGDQAPADPRQTGFRSAEAGAGAKSGGRRARRPTTSRTSSNCPRPTGNWRSRSAFARSPALRWARWAFPSRSPCAASRSSCAAKGASARPSEAPTKC